MESMEIKGKTILVTGGAGFIGSHMVEVLLKQNVRVLVLDKLVGKQSYFHTKHLDAQAIVINADVCNYRKLLYLLKKYSVMYIVHFAAQSLVEKAYDAPRSTILNNINSAVAVLEAARKSKTIKGIIMASSDKAYGKSNIAYRENDPLRGDHPYEVSKTATDLIATSYYKTYGVPVVITRFGNVYGEGDCNFSRIIPAIMKSVISNRILILRSDGSFVRDYVYVKDIVQGCLHIIDRFPHVIGEAFNLSSNDTFSVIALIKKVANALHTQIPYRVNNYQINEIPHQTLNFTKAKKLLRYKPQYKLTEVIPNIYRWYYDRRIA